MLDSTFRVVIMRSEPPEPVLDVLRMIHAGLVAVLTDNVLLHVNALFIIVCEGLAVIHVRSPAASKIRPSPCRMVDAGLPPTAGNVLIILFREPNWLIVD